MLSLSQLHERLRDLSKRQSTNFENHITLYEAESIILFATVHRHENYIRGVLRSEEIKKLYDIQGSLNYFCILIVYRGR